MLEPNPEELNDLDGVFEYAEGVTNLGCECDRRREVDEK